MSKSCISHQCPRYATCKLGKLENPTSIPVAMGDYMNLVTGSNTLGDPIYACGPAGDYKMYELGPGVVVVRETLPIRPTVEPSRICAVCETKIVKSEFWICPGCLATLKQIIQERTNTQYHTMKHHD